MKNIHINEVYTLFEEIKELIKKGNTNSTVIQPEIDIPDLSVINGLTDKLNEAIEETRKPVKTEHRHIFSIASNKVFVGIIGVLLICFFCLFIIFHQRSKISSHKDNDLKYRYIKMKSEITPKEMIYLEYLFEHKRDSIKFIRSQVHQYEKEIIEEAKRLEKARLKELEAERLQLEAEKLKNNTDIKK